MLVVTSSLQGARQLGRMGLTGWRMMGRHDRSPTGHSAETARNKGGKLQKLSSPRALKFMSPVACMYVLVFSCYLQDHPHEYHFDLDSANKVLSAATQGRDS